MIDSTREPSDAVVEYVVQWCRERSDRVSELFVESRVGKTLFYIVPRSDEYNFELGFEQSKLDLYLNRHGAIGYAETRQIPGWDLDTFVGHKAHRIWTTDQN